MASKRRYKGGTRNNGLPRVTLRPGLTRVAQLKAAMRELLSTGAVSQQGTDIIHRALEGTYIPKHLDQGPQVSKPAARAAAVTALLLKAGWSEDGATATQTVRMPTSKSPVYGHGAKSGGELRTFGGRTRLARGPLRLTVGERTCTVYKPTARGDMGFPNPVFLDLYATGVLLEKLERGDVLPWIHGDLTKGGQ